MLSLFLRPFLQLAPTLLHSDTRSVEEELISDQCDEAKQEFQCFFHSMLPHRLHGIYAQRSDAADGQPWAIQDASVAQHPLGDPAEDFLIDPTHQTTGKENQKQVTQEICFLLHALCCSYCNHSAMFLFYLCEVSPLVRECKLIHSSMVSRTNPRFPIWQ